MSRKRSIYQAVISHIVCRFSNSCIFAAFRFQGQYNIQILIPYLYIYYSDFTIPCKFHPSSSVYQQADGQRSCIGKCEVSLRPLVFGLSIDTIRYGNTLIIDTIHRWLKVLSAAARKRTRIKMMTRIKISNASSFWQVRTTIPCYLQRVQVKITQIPSSYSVIKYTARTCQTQQTRRSSNKKWVNASAMRRSSSYTLWINKLSQREKIGLNSPPTRRIK